MTLYCVTGLPPFLLGGNGPPDSGGYSGRPSSSRFSLTSSPIAQYRDDRFRGASCRSGSLTSRSVTVNQPFFAVAASMTRCFVVLAHFRFQLPAGLTKPWASRSSTTSPSIGSPYLGGSIRKV